MTLLEKALFLYNWGIQIKQIASRAGVDASTVSKWFGGQTLSPKNEEKLANAIQSFVDEFYRAFGANSNQSTLSTLQTSPNGEAT